MFRLLGAKDLGVSDDYTKEKMPAVNVSLLDGQLAWRQHDGGHTDGPNWKYFIPWADKFLKHAPAAQRERRAIVQLHGPIGAAAVGPRAGVRRHRRLVVATARSGAARKACQPRQRPAGRLPIEPRRAPIRTR